MCEELSVECTHLWKNVDTQMEEKGGCIGKKDRKS